MAFGRHRVLSDLSGVRVASVSFKQGFVLDMSSLDSKLRS